MENWGYFIFSSYSFPIGIGLALLIRKRLPFSAGLLWAYLIITVCVEVVGIILYSNKINNLWLYRIYLYIELIFPTLLFYTQFSKSRSKIFLLLVFLAALILTTLTNLFDDWQEHASVQTGITFGFIAFTIINYFIEMFRMEKVFNPFRDIYFVVGATLLVGQSGTLIYNLVYDYIVVGYFGDQMLGILNRVNMGLVILYNLLYSYGIWISRHSRI